MEQKNRGRGRGETESGKFVWRPNGEAPKTWLEAAYRIVYFIVVIYGLRGIVTLASFGFAYFVYRDVLLPATARHVDFIDAMEKRMDTEEAQRHLMIEELEAINETNKGIRSLTGEQVKVLQEDVDNTTKLRENWDKFWKMYEAEALRKANDKNPRP